ncbi:MAG: hypothetical protein M1833_005458 [Piccolia ochrophora]|nr:MAG: hypothetical protein M1833_005458 [Piccolia ochrophora]
MKNLSAAVDVYSDWIDACDAVAKDDARDTHPQDSYTGGGGGTGSLANDVQGATYTDQDGGDESALRDGYGHD